MVHYKTCLMSLLMGMNLLFLGTAIAQSVMPTGPFTGEGWITLDNSGAGGIGLVTCDAVVHGEANSDAAVGVYDVELTSDGLLYCLPLLLQAQNLPWSGQIENPTEISLEDMWLEQVLQPGCGPDDVVAEWTNGDPNSTSDPALITFDNTMLGSCVIVDGELEVTHDATGVGLEFTP